MRGEVVSEVFSQPDICWQMLKDYRLNRLRDSMRKRDIHIAILTNPLSMRYAIDYWNYPLFLSRIPTTQLIIPLDGPIAACGAYTFDNDDIAINLPMVGLSAFDGGLNNEHQANQFVSVLKDYMRQCGMDTTGVTIGIDRLDANVFKQLAVSTIRYCDITTVIEEAKSIKSDEEIALIRHSIKVAETGMESMYNNMMPGKTETEIWSILHQSNIAQGGYWTDGNMLGSGQRTNPWLQDASLKVIKQGELVAFDTDMVGPYSYMADISRTWLCGDIKPTKNQEMLYQYAIDEVYHNMELVKPGVSFREFSHKALRPPERFHALRYPCVAHGVGMCDEYPKIAYWQDWHHMGYDGLIEPGMVLCIESYIGAEGDFEGVKLEEQVLVTDTGYEKLSHFPLGLRPF